MISLPPPVVDPTSTRPGRTTSRDSGHNSHRSSRSHGHRSHSSGSRSRNRHRHTSGRHHSRHNCRTYFQYKERNFAAATSSMVAIVLLCTALVPDWIYMKGGECHIFNSKKGSLHHLSTSQFFYSGHFYESKSFTAKPGDVIYHFSADSYDIMVNCVTHSCVLLFKASIAFTLIAICLSFLAFFLDLIGPKYNILKVLRRIGIFNILTVIMCVTINLFTYLITTTVEKLQIATRLHPGEKVVVTFDASFYLITAAGGVSVLATACNCLRRHSFSSSSHYTPLSDQPYDDDTESLLPLPPSSPFDSEMILDVDLPPPPAYTP